MVSAWARGASVCEAVIPEPLAALRQAYDTTADVPLDGIQIPALVVAGHRDPLSPAATAAKLAALIGGDLQVCAHNHALHQGPRWREVATVVHSWLADRFGGARTDRPEQAPDSAAPA